MDSHLPWVDYVIVAETFDAQNCIGQIINWDQQLLEETRKMVFESMPEKDNGFHEVDASPHRLLPYKLSLIYQPT